MRMVSGGVATTSIRKFHRWQVLAQRKIVDDLIVRAKKMKLLLQKAVSL